MAKYTVIVTYESNTTPVALVNYTPAGPLPVGMEYTLYKMNGEIALEVNTLDDNAAFLITNTAGQLPSLQQRGNVQLSMTSGDRTNVEWTVQGQAVRLDVLGDGDGTQLDLTDESRPPQALKVVVKRQ